MAAAVFTYCGCLSDSSFSIQEDNRKEEAKTPVTYTISAPDASFDTEVKELSSICLKPSRNGFYAVGDEGDVFELDLKGKTVSKLMSKSGHDWEGVDCNGNDIYLMEETESALYKFSGGSLSLVSTVEIPEGGVSGKGPEGLMFARDTIYIGNQESPTRIVKYSIKESRICGHFDISFVSRFISDLCYDSSDNTMWIVDSKGPAFYHCTLDGKLLATYNIPFVKQAEAIAVDHASGTVWIGCDKTSNLYEIKIDL